MSATAMSGPTGRARASGAPVLILVWLAFCILLTAMWMAGHSPHGDVDDLLKAREVRLLVDTGDIFGRTIPGILQPEPFVSHWPWIVDLPYAAVALVLRPFTGEPAALSAAFFAVPLLLLAPTLVLLRSIVGRLGFDHPDIVFLVSALPLLGMVGEFEPGRIDYHNLQMLLLAACVRLLLAPGLRTALLNGVLAALAMAIGLELALFFLLVMAILSLEFVFGGRDAARRLQAYGLGLAAAAGGLFFVVVSPANYGVAFCDRYASPLTLALIAAGCSFIAVPALAGRAGPAGRIALLAACAAASATVLAALFPECLAGPYGALPDYVRGNWLARLDQEKSLFARPDFVLSNDMAYKGLAMVGALASLGAAWALRWRDRAWTIQCLFAVLATAHAVLYFRYLRFVPMFAGPGLAYALALALPPGLGRWLAGTASRASTVRLAPLMPGLALVAALVGFHLVVRPQDARLDAVETAAACDLSKLGTYRWPAGARVLAPPLVGIYLTDRSSVDVVAVPFHAGAPGIERAYRFFDPATADPQGVAREAAATHVAVCAWRGQRLQRLESAFPLTAALIQGQPPVWLSQCPDAPSALLRVYGITGADGKAPACPTTP